MLHFKKLIYNFDMFLKEKLSDEQNQYKTLSIVYKVWSSNENRLINIFDQLVTLNLIDPNVIIRFIFEQIKNNKFTRNLYWKEWTILKNILTIKNYSGHSPVNNQKKDDDMEQDIPMVKNIEPDLNLINDCFSECIKGIENPTSQDYTDIDEKEAAQNIIPTIKRIENIKNRHKCFQRQFL